MRSGHQAQDRFVSGWGTHSSYILQMSPRRLAYLLACLGAASSGQLRSGFSGGRQAPAVWAVFQRPSVTATGVSVSPHRPALYLLRCRPPWPCSSPPPAWRAQHELCCAAPIFLQKSRRAKECTVTCTLEANCALPVRQRQTVCLLSDLQTPLHLSWPRPVSALYKHHLAQSRAGYASTCVG